MAHGLVRGLARLHALAWGQQEEQEWKLQGGSLSGNFGECIQQWPFKGGPYAAFLACDLDQLAVTHSQQCGDALPALKALKAAMASRDSAISTWVRGVREEGKGVNTVTHGDAHAWNMFWEVKEGGEIGEVKFVDLQMIDRGVASAGAGARPVC